MISSQVLPEEMVASEAYNVDYTLHIKPGTHNIITQVCGSGLGSRVFRMTSDYKCALHPPKPLRETESLFV